MSTYKTEAEDFLRALLLENTIHLDVKISILPSTPNIFIEYTQFYNYLHNYGRIVCFCRATKLGNRGSRSLVCKYSRRKYGT